MELAKYDFAKPNDLEDADIEAILARADDFISWCNDIKEYALGAAIAGKAWTNYKLVEGRSTRKYTSESDVAKAVKEVKQGKIAFKVDKGGIVHTSIGKVSFSPEMIRENAVAFIQTLIKLKPAAAKGTYIKSIYLSSTMSKGIKVDTKSIEA